MDLIFILNKNKNKKMCKIKITAKMNNNKAIIIMKKFKRENKEKLIKIINKIQGQVTEMKKSTKNKINSIQMKTRCRKLKLSQIKESQDLLILKTQKNCQKIIKNKESEKDSILLKKPLILMEDLARMFIRI